MSKYQYVILRYVHNVSTEEFVNIGVVMWLPEERRLLHSISEKYSRLSCFFLRLQVRNSDGCPFPRPRPFPGKRAAVTPISKPH